MNNLINIKNENGINLVSARELLVFLEVKSKFADWIKNRIEKYEFIENEDYTKISKILDTPGGKQNSIDYILKIDMAKELSMVENNEKGKIARRYFIECEKQLIKNNEKINSYMIPELFELTCVLFETDYKEILKKFEQGEL